MKIRTEAVFWSRKEPAAEQQQFGEPRTTLQELRFADMSATVFFFRLGLHLTDSSTRIGLEQGSPRNMAMARPVRASRLLACSACTTAEAASSWNSAPIFCRGALLGMDISPPHQAPLVGFLAFFPEPKGNRTPRQVCSSLRNLPPRAMDTFRSMLQP